MFLRSFCANGILQEKSGEKGLKLKEAEEN
jgi:hypothetical protein